MNWGRGWCGVLSAFEGTTYSLPHTGTRGGGEFTGAMEESSGKWQVLGFAECSGFGACAHIVRSLVRVDVAVGQRDLRAGPIDIEAAALPEK